MRPRDMTHPRPGLDNPVKPAFPSLMHRVAIIYDVPSSLGLRLRPRYHVASGRLSQVRHPFASVPQGAVGGRLRRSETQGLETNSARRENVGGELPHISTTIGTPSEEVSNMFGRIPSLGAVNIAREMIRPTPQGGRKGGVPEQVNSAPIKGRLPRRPTARPSDRPWGGRRVRARDPPRRWPRLRPRRPDACGR